MESLGLSGLFGGAYEGRRVLVTGHTGFKGSWLCLWLAELGARVTGLALPPDTEPAHWPLLGLANVDNRHVDLREPATVQRTLLDSKPEIVFHLAAQALVRRSYREPRVTFETNVLGLVHLLDAVRECGSVRALVNATTDKVYLDLPTESGYVEDDPLGGHDPYSTSKACAELLSDCYRKSYFTQQAGSRVRLATARAGNVIGGGDWSEDRLVPDLVRAASTGSILHIRNPDAIRPWQHVLEPLSGYLRLGEKLLAGEDVQGPWNFGPGSDAELTVHSLVSQMQTLWPEVRSEYDTALHPHEAATLRLDCSKAAAKLAWNPVWNAQEAIRRTIQWYRNYYYRGNLGSKHDLRDYVAAAQAAGQEWAV